MRREQRMSFLTRLGSEERSGSSIHHPGKNQTCSSSKRVMTPILASSSRREIWSQFVFRKYLTLQAFPPFLCPHYPCSVNGPGWHAAVTFSTEWLLVWITFMTTGSKPDPRRLLRDLNTDQGIFRRHLFSVMLKNKMWRWREGELDSCAVTSSRLQHLKEWTKMSSPSS